MFKGFEIPYPEYEVITPQTNKSYTVRSLNVQEEEKLKGSLITPTKVAEHLNSCLFNSIVNKPDEITDIDSFLRGNTLKDRDALLYGLYHISYEEIRNYQIKCNSCGKEYPVTVKASSTFNFNGYPSDSDILKDRKEVPLPALKGVTVIVRQPTLFDEINNIKVLSNRPGNTLELITETLIIESISVLRESTKEPVIYHDRADIMDAYLQMTSKDKRAIYKAYADAFGDYGIELKMASSCVSCGQQDTHTIDLVESFFRALFSA